MVVVADYAPISTYAKAFAENPYTQSADEIAQRLSPHPLSNSIDEEDFHTVLGSERFTQFADAVAQLLISRARHRFPVNPVYQDDYQWDSSSVGRWETLAKTLPAMVTRGAIVVECGKPHFKGPPLVKCPRCKIKLTHGTATLTFRHAPAATQMQRVEAWVCSCGEFYVPGDIAREAYLRAFQRSPSADEKELQELRQTLLRWAGKAKGLPADLALNHDHYLHGRPKK